MNYKILIVDDEQLERRALESIIVLQLGTRVEIMQAVNGRDAVQMAREFRPDIAFLDIKMPIMNGIEAGKEILEFFAGLLHHYADWIYLFYLCEGKR